LLEYIDLLNFTKYVTNFLSCNSVRGFLNSNFADQSLHSSF